MENDDEGKEQDKRENGETNMRIDWLTFWMLFQIKQKWKWEMKEKSK